MSESTSHGPEDEAKRAHQERKVLSDRIVLVRWLSLVELVFRLFWDR